jgi:hypothetical protein
MRKFIVAVFVLAVAASSALAQSQQAPTLRIVSEDGNRLPSDLMYGNTKVKPLRLRPGTNVPITIDDTDFFVQQQYVDFLSRFPDQSGFAFWQNDINQCTTQGCIDAHRVNVSAAFFLSIEFQDTGYLVYRLNKAAFGNLPNAPVPVQRETFMPDARSISNGVVVNVGNWQQQLEANKVSFTQGFVQRPAFLSAYPTSMTADAFVSALNANTGGVLTSADVTQLDNVFGGPSASSNDTAKRAQVLRSVAENATFSAQEKNRAFVLMQYFGYLKRNPNDLPDADYSGYNFWLSKLDQFQGDFTRAEMVKAFITSIEYRSRF